jgi:hypothetical protein
MRITKNHIITLILLVFVLVSHKAILFTWNLIFTARHFHEDKDRASVYMIRSLNYKPTVYGVYKKYKNSRIDSLIVKTAIYSRYNKNRDVFKSYKQEGLSFTHFQSIFKNNFYLKHLFDDSTEIQAYENLDSISLKILADQTMNPLSVLILEQIKQKFSEGFLNNLVDYCSWKENYPLRDYLMKTLSLNDPGGKISKIESLPMEKSIEVLNKLLSEKHEIKGISLGNNLVKSGSFEDVDQIISNWNFSNMAGFKPFSDGSFTMGSCQINGNGNLRLMGFFVNNEQGKSNARGGAWYGSLIPTEKKYYLFSFDYMVKTGKERPAFWLSKGIPEQRLPPTKGKWKKVLFFFNNSKGATTFWKPLIRMWGTGSMWIDNVVLIKIPDPKFSFSRSSLLYTEEI